MATEESADTKFSPSQMAEFHESFQIFDKDSDGKINIDELALLLKATGFNPPMSDIIDYCAQIDKNDEGFFNFGEFIQIVDHYNEFSNLDDILTTCLRVFFESDKKVTTEALKSILTTIGNPLTPDEIKHLFFNIDPDNEGSVSIADFVTKISGQTTEE